MGFPVTINGNTYTDADFSPYGYVTAFPNILNDLATVAEGIAAAATGIVLGTLAVSGAGASSTIYDTTTYAAGVGGIEYFDFKNASGTQRHGASIRTDATTGTNAAEVADMILATMRAGTLTDAWKITGDGTLAPTTSDGAALGSASFMVSDLFLASGSVINWNNGDVTLTHSANLLTLAGGNLTVPAITASSQAVIASSTYWSWTVSNTDIDALISGGTFGTLIQAIANGHFTIGLRDNDTGDGFQIISGGGNWATDSTYDLLCFEVKSTGVTTVGGSITANSFIPNSSTVPTNGMYLPASNNLGWAINSAGELGLTAAALYPITSGGLALGTSSLMWADLFLASGSVVNFNNGDVTITHASNTLSFAGAASGYTFTGGPVVPATNDAAALGTTALMWSDLFLASGSVINWNSGDLTLTHSANLLTLAGGSLSVADMVINGTITGTYTLGGTPTLPAASTTAAGASEFATAAEYRTGTDTGRSLVVSEVWTSALNATLTDGASIAVNLASGFNFGGSTTTALSLAGDRALAAPSNAKGGQSGVLWFAAATTTRTLTLDAAWNLMTGVETGPYSITTSQLLGVAYIVLGTTVYVTAIIRRG